MATSKNTNNSLSDLNNEGQGFNKSLRLDNNSDGSISNQTVSKQEKLKSEIKELEKKRSTASTEKEKDSFTNQIDTKNKELSRTDTLSNDDLSNMDSLFDSNALIDYGRYIKSDGTIQANWKRFNSDYDKENGQFTFKPNNSDITAKNTPVLYNDSDLDSDEGLSLPKLIAWSEKYPALQLKFQDFAYCKKLGYYPNNRLIVLRRFKAGIPDNLFDYVNDSTTIEFNQPLSTMITWWKPDEDMGDMEFSFNENWESHKDGIMETFKSSLSDATGVSIGDSEVKKDGKKANIASDLVTALIADSFVRDKNFRKEDGVPYTRSSVGSPNLIHEAMARKTGGDGMSSKVSFNLKFEYEMRDINGIDPGIAMLDLISNCTRMGTSVSEFRYNIPFLTEEAVSIKALINGDIGKALDAFKSDLKLFTDGVKDGFEEISKDIKAGATAIATGIANVAENAVKYIMSRYREKLKAAISADTGLPSGIWHVTIGNPKSPIVSCGDLIISSSTLKLGNELGYNDFPNEFSVTYKLNSARPRGRDELNRIFNAGRGRVYVYPKAKDNPDYDLYSNGNS